MTQSLTKSIASLFFAVFITAKIIIEEPGLVPVKGGGNKLWKSGRIPFVTRHYYGDYTAKYWQPYLDMLFSLWQNQTCLKFIPYKSSDNHFLLLKIEPKKNFTCYIDKIEKIDTLSILTIPENCEGKNLMLEISRSLGLLPQHRRPDRDLYLQVDESVKNKSRYTILPEMNTLGFPFDYASVMQLSVNDTKLEKIVFKANKHLDARIASEVSPSFYDKKAVSYLYGCNATCTTMPKCLNGGYVVARLGCNICQCYPGYTGNRCEKVDNNETTTAQHQWATYFVKKIPLCKLNLIVKYMKLAVKKEIKNLISNKYTGFISKVVEKKIFNILKGTIQHLPYSSVGGICASLFVKMFFKAMVGIFGSEEMAVSVLGGSEEITLLDLLKKDLKKALNKGLNSGGKSQRKKVALAIGEAFGETIGAEMHGPIGHRILVVCRRKLEISETVSIAIEETSGSKARHLTCEEVDEQIGKEMSELIHDCLDKVLYDINSLWDEVKKYYDTEML